MGGWSRFYSDRCSIDCHRVWKWLAGRQGFKKVGQIGSWAGSWGRKKPFEQPCPVEQGHGLNLGVRLAFEDHFLAACPRAAAPLDVELMLCEQRLGTVVVRLVWL